MLENRLIDLNALGIGKCNPDVFENRAYADGWNAAIKVIETAPTVDAVEVVRCNDCKWLNVVNNDNLFACCVKTGYMFLPFQTDIRTHFCSFGERMASENGVCM